MTSDRQSLQPGVVQEATPLRQTVITFGTFDLFHYGHLRIVERAAALGGKLVVGVSSDKLNWEKKKQHPVVGQDERMALVWALRCVSDVFLEESLELKKEYCQRFSANIFVMGDDHLQEYDEMLAGVCKCFYFPRTENVSTTKLKKEISESSLATSPGMATLPDSPQRSMAAAESPSSLFHRGRLPLKTLETSRTYLATGDNLTHSASQSNPVTAFLVRAHDCYYDIIMVIFTPICRAMPREVTLLGKQVTVFTANIVTYARGFLVIIIALCMKYTCLRVACFLVMLHDFLDHIDGVVAKQQAKDGRSKGDDPAFGAFVDAQMDKLVFCVCLWSFLLFVDYMDGSFMVNTLVVLTAFTLIGVEVVIACVRTVDYFQVKFTPPERSGSGPALRAVSEGKLKQKFESIGVALYCLTLPSPTRSLPTTLVATLCLWFAGFFSYQSLMHKLRARTAES